MKRILILLVALAGVVAAIFFLRRPGKAPASQVAAVLSAQHTGGLAGVADLQGWLSEIDRLVHDLPAPVAAELGPLLDPAQRKARLGFDPLIAADWQALGIDLGAGAALVLDDRIETPLALLPVSDRAKLLAWLEPRIGKLEIGEGNGKSEVFPVAGRRVLVGKRGAYTLLAAPGAEKWDAARVAFDQILDDSGPALAADAAFGNAFREVDGPLRFFAYGAFAGGRSWIVMRDGTRPAPDTLDFYQKLFPALAAWLTPTGPGARLIASPDGQAILAKLLDPKTAAPAWSRYVPRQGWSASRASVNLPEVFEGVNALLPPATPPKVRSGITMAKAMLSLLAGFSWEEVAAAFSGHVLFAADVASAAAALHDPMAGRWLLLVGVADATQADALLPRMLDLAANRLPGISWTPVEAGARKGAKVQVGASLQAVVLRDGDVLVVAPSVEAAQAAIDRVAADSLAASPFAPVLDGDVVLGTVTDLSPLLQALAERGNLTGVLDSAPVRALREKPFVSATVKLDAGGLALSDGGADGPPAAVLVGAAAALLVPTFQKYGCAARVAGAEEALKAMMQGAVSAWAASERDAVASGRAPRFPASGGLTPAGAACVADEPVAVDAADWTGEPWKSLDFKPFSPTFYRFEYVSAGEGPGATFVARAVADIDCDGETAVLERGGRIDAEGKVALDAEVKRTRECE